MSDEIDEYPWSREQYAIDFCDRHPNGTPLYYEMGGQRIESQGSADWVNAFDPEGSRSLCCRVRLETTVSMHTPS